MKAVILKIKNKTVYALMENGKFIRLPYKKGMQTGMHIHIQHPVLSRMSAAVRAAACLVAFVFTIQILFLYFFVLLR
jgi:hypothetical protein